MNRQNYLWCADCLNVAIVLAMSQGPRRLRKLARRFGLIQEGAEPDMIDIFRMLHEACHHDAELSKTLARELDDRFRSTLLRVRSMDAGEIKSLKMDWPVPLLWAVLRDDRDEVWAYSRYLVHSLAWDGFRRISERKETERGLQRPIDLLQAQLRLQRTQISSLRQDLEKAKDEAACLQKLLSMKERHVEETGANDAGWRRLARQIQKLRHDLEKERRRVEELEAVVSKSGLSSRKDTLLDGAAAGTCEKPRISFCENGPALLQPGDHCVEEKECCKECPLEGLRVALVGGLTRMLPEYKRVVTQLGAEFLFHDGEVRSGFKLKSVVCGADIVVFITSVNSHNALSVVRAVCKNRQKKFVVLRETGSESLKRTLRKYAA